ncbi:MAG: EAL domain-containing protein [Magnetococcales bacterium]|nr:EAL domain-containing protein [Magnetococcales bacterium]
MTQQSSNQPPSETAKNQDDFRELTQTLQEGILIHRDGVILYANPAARKIIDAPDQESPLDNNLFELLHPDSREKFIQASHDIISGEKQWAASEIRLEKPDGNIVEMETSSGPTPFQGQLALFTVMRDISQRKRQEERIHHQANYDNLTGLPNRTLFYDRLTQETVRANRQNSRVALMFIDLDRFKWVNDTLGHAAGDQLLKDVSERLLSVLRKSDTVARLGGDEFTAILPDMAKGPFAERVAGEILKQLATPFILEGQEVFISGSVGVTVYPDDADDVDGLLRNADSAMYRAKHDGRNAFRFFTPDMHTEAQERMELEKDLHRAMERNQLVIRYQPIIQLETGKVVGAESFLRWNHPTKGWVSPSAFIPLAEEIGLISQFTEWMLQTACTQAQTWRKQFDFDDFFITVNLSCTRCRELSTDDKIPGILRETGLPPTALVLEITENILMEDEERAMSMLNHLTHLGVNLWLDDFGTGYSSLSILKQLPVNGIKIDRAFVPDVLTDPETVVLVEAIVSLAHSLKRQVIGEGVESAEQAQFLKDRGCLMGQGYYFGRPMCSVDFEKMLAKKF